MEEYFPVVESSDQTWILDTDNHAAGQMFAKVILASRHPDPEAPEIYTLHLRYPRIIHAEIMTHRVFSRNARSSRAVPVKTMLSEVRDTPFVPWHWGANQKGMQAGEKCNAEVAHPNSPGAVLSNKTAWLVARTNALRAAQAFDDAGYHKQIANRLLEPFMWIDTLVTSTEWENFLWLRDHEAAEPHLQDLARLVKAAIDNAKLQELQITDWHLPYITEADTCQMVIASGRLASDRYFELTGSHNHMSWLRRISAARCARISYAPFDGDASYEKEFERYNLLVKSDRVHASPLEHQATPDQWIPSTNRWFNAPAQGNLTGWVQARKLVVGENRTKR